MIFYYFREKDTKLSENITTDDKKKILTIILNIYRHIGGI